MTIEEAGSPTRREEGSSAGCLALQSGEEVTPQLCWKCGKSPATQQVYGFPMCDKCAKDPDFDPEEMEDTVIEKFAQTKNTSSMVLSTADDE